MLCSAAASGWAGWALAHLEFGSSVNPITTMGADYVHHITASPPGFEIPAESLDYDSNKSTGLETAKSHLCAIIAKFLVKSFLDVQNE